MGGGLAAGGGGGGAPSLGNAAAGFSAASTGPFLMLGLPTGGGGGGAPVEVTGVLAPGNGGLVGF